MLNELEQLAASHCVIMSMEIKSMSNQMMGNNIKKLSEHGVQEKVLTISSKAEQIERWVRAMQNNSCNCSQS